MVSILFRSHYCISLTLTLNTKLIYPGIARWGLELEIYYYKIRQRKEELMSHVDVLSRMPNCQARDTSIQNIRERLERDNVEGYELENGYVF